MGFVAQVEDLVPGRSREVRLQSFSLEGSLPKPEATAAVPFRNGPTETLFDNRLHRCLLPLGQLPHFFVKTIWNLYGCFHMANHTTWYGMMSSKSIKAGDE